MIKNQILCLELTSVERHVLYCHFSLLYQFYDIMPEDLEEIDKLDKIVSESICLFINPKKLTVTQFRNLLDAHENAKDNTHTSPLLFTAPFTREQHRYVDIRELTVINLRTKINKNLKNAVDIIKKTAFPCWDCLERMKANMFNDGWYLITLKTTGYDPTADHILAIDIAYMANYQIMETERIVIKPPHPISDEDEEENGITNATLKDGVTREEAVERLNHLRYHVPFILQNEEFYHAFLKALYHFCDKKFDHPYIAIDGLCAIVFGYMLFRRSEDIARNLPGRKYPRTPVDVSELAHLYDITLAVFENLQDRYDVRAPGQFKDLYFSNIRCGD